MVLPDSGRVSRVPPYLGRAPTQVIKDFIKGAITLYGWTFQNIRLSWWFVTCGRSCETCDEQPRNPGCATVATYHTHLGLGSSPFARRYWGNLNWCLFLRVLRCFSSPSSLQPPILFSGRWHISLRAGFPHSEIHGSGPVWRLPVAYRSLLRPSSLVDAQASTVRPYSLNHILTPTSNPLAGNPFPTRLAVRANCILL